MCVKKKTKKKQPNNGKRSVFGCRVSRHASLHLLFPLLFEGSVESRRPGNAGRGHAEVPLAGRLELEMQLCNSARWFFFPAAEEGMCCGVTQGEAGRIWQWTMDKPLHNIHYVLGWNVSKLDARSPNSPFLWTGALLFFFPNSAAFFHQGICNRKCPT